jgi:N-acetylglucosamine-6-phosphate deacetylase
MTLALVNGRVLLADGFAHGRCVLIDQGRIVDVVGFPDRRCRGAARYDLGGQMLLPGFIDSQVNGGGGVLFNDAPSVASIRAIGRAHRRFGTTGFLPTLISADLDIVAGAIAAVRGALEANVPGVLGIHIEGPFLSVARKGVHDPAKLRELDHRAPGGGGRGGVGRSYQRDVCRNARRARARPHRLHSPLQRHVAAHGARTGRSGRCSR